MPNFKDHRVVASFASGSFATAEAAVITYAELVPPGVTRPHKSPGHWQVQITWRYRDGDARAEPEEMLIVRGPGREHRRPVSASIVRNLPLGTMIDESRKVLIARASKQTDENEGPELWAKFAGLGPHRGTEITAEQDQAAADVYRSAWRKGAYVTQAVADHFGVSKSAATKRISRARAAGLLDGIGPKR
jgi:hypothetical protein